MPLPNPVTPVEWVSIEIIRQIFKESGFYEAILSGKFFQWIKRSSHPNPPPDGEPFCTHSQIAYYYNSNGEPVAVVHQYLRPDGSIGASGLPDPKRLILQDRIVAVRS